MNKLFHLVKKIVTKKRGFSMVGVIIAAGMAAGLAMFIAQTMKQQHSAQKLADTRAEVNAFSQRINRALYDGEACLLTLKQGQTNRNIVAGSAGEFTLRTIKNSDGDEIIKTIAEDASVTYGNRLLKVSSMKVWDIRITGNQAEAKLEVVIRRESQAVTGQKTVKRQFPMTLNLDTTPNPDRLVSCVADGATDMEGMCNSLSGVWDGTAQTCTLPTPTASASPLANLACTGSTYLRGFNNGVPDCQPLPSVPNIPTIPPNPYLALNCNANQIVGFSAPGVPACVATPTGGGSSNNIVNKQCATGEALVGFDGSGDVVCTTLATGVSGGPGMLPGCIIYRSENCSQVRTDPVECAPATLTNPAAISSTGTCPTTHPTLRYRHHSLEGYADVDYGAHPWRGKARWVRDTFCCIQ